MNDTKIHEMTLADLELIAGGKEAKKAETTSKGIGFMNFLSENYVPPNEYDA